MNFDKIKKDNFFIIDSDNLDSIKTKLYGFAIIDSKIYFNTTEDVTVDGTGSYIYITTDSKNEKIKIYQDLNGNYGLYLFKKDDYFAISNSFILLVEYLKEKYELSLNYDYARSYMSCEICSYIYEETLINEITILPRDVVFCIEKRDKTIYFEKINYEENTITINSKEGIDILDKWFLKWSKLIKNIKYETNNIIADLTGGLDSRTVFSLILSSNINLNEINIQSSTSNMYKEDYEIASEIANYFNFKLNQPSDITYNNLSTLETYLNISFYSKLGFSKAIWPTRQYPTSKVYNIVGYGGECIRNYIPSTKEENINFKVNLAKKYSNEWEETTKKYLKNNYENLEKKVLNENISIVNSNYKETRSRYHFGKSVVERYLINQINLAPLIDPLLYKLNYMEEQSTDDNLLIALIIGRYCEPLLNFKIEGSREIPESTINYVKEINNKFPFNNKLIEDNENQIHIIEENGNNEIEESKSNIKYSIDNVNDFLRDVFKSNAFKNKFKMYFPEEAYEKIIRDLDKHYIWGMCDIFSMLGVFYMIKIVEDSEQKNFDNPSTWLNAYLTIPPYYTEDYRIKLEKELEIAKNSIEKLTNENENKSNTIQKLTNENKNKNNTIQKLTNENKNKNNTIQKLTNENENKSNTIQKLTNEINTLKNSNSWKITEPPRKFFDLFKK